MDYGKDEKESQQQVNPHEHMESEAATKTNTSDHYRELKPLLRHTRIRNTEAMPISKQHTQSSHPDPWNASHTCLLLFRANSFPAFSTTLHTPDISQPMPSCTGASTSASGGAPRQLQELRVVSANCAKKSSKGSFACVQTAELPYVAISFL